VTPSSSLVLKSDFTWSIDLGGAKSSEHIPGHQLLFDKLILNLQSVTWTDFATNQALSDKLKKALQEVGPLWLFATRPIICKFSFQ
jgi:hypothetical protein